MKLIGAHYCAQSDVAFFSPPPPPPPSGLPLGLKLSIPLINYHKGIDFIAKKAKSGWRGGGRPLVLHSSALEKNSLNYYNCTTLSANREQQQGELKLNYWIKRLLYPYKSTVLARQITLSDFCEASLTRWIAFTGPSISFAMRIVLSIRCVQVLPNDTVSELFELRWSLLG